MSGYEETDISVAKTVIGAIVVVLFIGVFLVILNEYFLSVKEEIVYETVLKPESISLKELYLREDSVLTTYELTDTAKGIYRIPIDKALEIVAQEAQATR